MGPQHEQRDQQFDQNLRRLASQLQVPRRRPPRRSRVLRLLTWAGSATAAMVAFALLVVAPTFQKVQADQILNAFRTTLLDGFKLEFQRFGTDDWQVSGELVMLPGGPGNEIDVFLDAQLSTPADPSLLLDTTLALTPDRQWALLTLQGADASRFQDEPFLASLAQLLDTGVVLQLHGVWEALQSDLINGRLARLLASSGAAGDPDSLIRALLLGRATHEELEQLVALIEAGAHDVRVQRVAGDLYSLHVSQLDPPIGSLSASDRALLQQVEIEIAYRSGQGIAWAEVRHLGDHDGTLRLEPTTRTGSGHLFDLERIAPSTATFLDMPAIVPTLVGYLS